MAEEAEGGPKYVLITENGEKKAMSREYAGKGTAYYSNNDIYEGDFLDGIREGRGKYFYSSNGDKYDGEWRQNFKHGIGKMLYNGKGEYNGYWENGRRHGEGVFTYPNGDIYSGWWKFGEKEGTGTYLYKASGMKIYGQWKQGKITHGKWIYPNGTFYEGGFANNKPSGKGKWVFKNGNELEGLYEQKKKEGEDAEDPPAEEGAEEGAEPKPKFTLHWHSNTHIAESAHMVNSVEQ